MSEEKDKKTEHDTTLAVMAIQISNIEKILPEIKEQTIYTNGKVAEISKWREQVIGGAKVAGVVVLPMLVWAFVTIRDLPEDIQKAVQSEITNKYNVEIR